MPPLSCLCPRCDTTLRVKDRSYLNRPIPCPACRALLVLTVNESEQLTVALQEDATSRMQDSSSKRFQADAALTLSRGMRERVLSVTVVSWTATLLVAGMIGVLVWRSGRPRPKSPLNQATEMEVVARDDDPSVHTVDPEPTAEISLDVPPQREEPIVAENQPPTAPVADEIETPPADALTVVKAPLCVPLMPVGAAPAAAPPVDFRQALSQPLAAFRQSAAMSRRELLDQLEELIGAPIRFDLDELGDAVAQLDEEITFDLQDTTVGDVLARVLDQTGIAYVEERDGLRLRRESTEASVPEESPKR